MRKASLILVAMNYELLQFHQFWARHVSKDKSRRKKKEEEKEK